MCIKLMFKRVLSIQSQVSCGYVGNNAVTVCLQANGFEVDTINTVSFSNHTGYGKWAGRALTPNEFKEIVSGLETNNLLHYSHIMTGYISSAELLDEIAIFIENIKKKYPSIIYLCDPVLGDNNKYYVPAELLDCYKKKLLPLADIITPNQFEAQWLSGINIQDERNVERCLLELLGKGPSTVIITSVNQPQCNDFMRCYAGVMATGASFYMAQSSIHKVPFSFVGTGDTCAALILASMDYFKDINKALEKTMEVMHQVLLKTIEKYTDLSSFKNMHESYKKELALINSIDILKFK